MLRAAAGLSRSVKKPTFVMARPTRGMATKAAEGKDAQKSDVEDKNTAKRKKSTTTTTTATTNKKKKTATKGEPEVKTTKTATKTASKTTTKTMTSNSKKKAGEEADGAKKAPAKRVRKTPAERDAGKTVFPREPIERKAVPSEEAKLFKVLSWNVNGLRAMARKQPAMLASLAQEEKPQIVCLQETKIQESHVGDFEKLLPGYTSFWSCSTVKKGYAGTALFVADGYEKCEVSYGIGMDKHEGEGRAITARLPFCNLVSLYVPNAGQDLKRLEYRTKEWDLDLRSYLRDLEAETGLPCIVCGDLNVAHRDLDVWNPDAKHVPKTAGSTPEERASFTEFLHEMEYVDAFRYLHGDAKGHFTYWSMRTNGRPFNRGNRLDYFCMPRRVAEAAATAADTPVRLHDTYVLHEPTVGVSDHCPVVCVLEDRSKET